MHTLQISTKVSCSSFLCVSLLQHLCWSFRDVFFGFDVRSLCISKFPLLPSLLFKISQYHATRMAQTFLKPSMLQYFSWLSTISAEVFNVLRKGFKFSFILENMLFEESGMLKVMKRNTFSFRLYVNKSLFNKLFRSNLVLKRRTAPFLILRNFGSLKFWEISNCFPLVVCICISHGAFLQRA